MLLVALLTAGAGLVALSVGSAAATTVSDEVGFRSAWGNPNEQQIDLTADITLTCPGGEALRNSSTPITVNGNAHTIRQTCAGQRVLDQVGSAGITFDGVTITGGTTPAAANGGGVRAPGGGTVTVTNSTVSGNAAGGNGGGVAAAGAVTVTNSTISGNTASVNGGGVGANGVITVTNSTISSNTASTGGGVAASAAVTITNSTFSGNAAPTGSGGGIAGTSVPVTATNSTFSNNAALFGGGISTGGRVTLVYATVVANTAPTGSNVRLFGTGTANLTAFGSVVALGNCELNGTTTSSNGFNFSDNASCGFTNTAQGDRENAGDPGLGTLSDNGGPTQTRLPQSGSPLIDAIPTQSCQADGASGITTDQRGISRPQGVGCDIGAVEVEQAPENMPLKNVKVLDVRGNPFPQGTAGLLACPLQGWSVPCTHLLVGIADANGVVQLKVSPTVQYRFSGFVVNTGWSCPGFVSPTGDEFHFSDNVDAFGRELARPTTFAIREPDPSECA
jgi:hypothetical protein